jgi:hypothetical protein
MNVHDGCRPTPLADDRDNDDVLFILRPTKVSMITPRDPYGSSLQSFSPFRSTYLLSDGRAAQLCRRAGASILWPPMRGRC